MNFFNACSATSSTNPGHVLWKVASLFDECSNLEHQLGEDWKISTWYRLIASVKLLLLQAEEETQALHGCLPLDHNDCKLMELAFGARSAICESYDFYILRREAKSK